MSKKKIQPLTRERVLRAAVRVADKRGIDSLSMRRLAEAVGVEAMSLYNHVRNKDDVLDGMVEIVANKIVVPSIDDDWRNAMRQRAISAHKVLLKHPWAAKLIVSRVNVGPVMLRYVDATIGCLYSAGFSYQLADRAWNAIDNHIYGFTLQALNFPFEASEFSEAAKGFLPMLSPDEYPYLNGLSRQIIEGSHDGVQNFCFGLDLILDGLERLREAN